MAQIDSGLGWSCDEAYYVATEGAPLCVGYTSSTPRCKGNNIPAIGGIVPVGGSNFFGMISTNTDALIVSYGTNADSILLDSYTDNNGIMWYGGAINNQKVASGGLPQFSQTGTSDMLTNAEKLVKYILENADVNIVTQKKIPTTNYVKSYIENIESETATRVKALYNMIAPTFSSSINYSVDDVVIYNNKLYKCTTAHSGDWNSGNFTETTIAQLLN